MTIGINPKKFIESILMVGFGVIFVLSFLGLFKLYNMSQPEMMNLRIEIKTFDRSSDWRSFRLIDTESGMHYTLSPTESWYDSVKEGDSFNREMIPVDSVENGALLFFLLIDVVLWVVFGVLIVFSFIGWCFKTDKEISFDINLPEKPFRVIRGNIEDKRERSIQ